MCANLLSPLELQYYHIGSFLSGMLAHTRRSKVDGSYNHLPDEVDLVWIGIVNIYYDPIGTASRAMST